MTEAADGKKRLIEYYDQEAPRYIELYRTEHMRQEFYPANVIRLEIVVGRLKARGARRVFDVGCGSGGPLVRFLREGFEARGIDFSLGMVEAARQIVAESGFDPTIAALGDLERSETLPPSGSTPSWRPGCSRTTWTIARPTPTSATTSLKAASPSSNTATP